MIQNDRDQDGKSYDANVEVEADVNIDDDDDSSQLSLAYVRKVKIDLGVTSGLFIYVFPQPGICSQLELLKVIGLPSYDTWKEWERSQLFHDPLFISQTMRKNANILLR